MRAQVIVRLARNGKAALHHLLVSLELRAVPSAALRLTAFTIRLYHENLMPTLERLLEVIVGNASRVSGQISRRTSGQEEGVIVSRHAARLSRRPGRVTLRVNQMSCQQTVLKALS